MLFNLDVNENALNGNYFRAQTHNMTLIVSFDFMKMKSNNGTTGLLKRETGAYNIWKQTIVLILAYRRLYEQNSLVLSRNRWSYLKTGKND